ncbi:hypothetical protein EWM64_g4061 [Hericium alpestre]|uniref:Transmembrane protein n=1 Tax=Hericium alpestre TaxID=135208 RepID=A0A4Y9ZYI6_9AGAM|nr:hypothetical protein EWM64_g4061 [Hericium alpestre]
MLSVSGKIWVNVKAVYLRITLTRVTSLFFIFAFVFCFSQAIMQSFLASLDAEWSFFLSNVVHQAGINQTNFVQYTGRHGDYSIQLCNNVVVAHSCVPFFTEGQTNTVVPPGFKRTDWFIDGVTPASDVIMRGSPGSSGNNVIIEQGSNPANFVQLSPQCTRTLLYPNGQLLYFEREQYTLIASQFWFFALSVFAIVQESPPHIWALLIGRGVASGWSIYSVWRNENIRDRVQHIIENPDTPCNLDIFTPYFRTRQALQITDLVLHCVAWVIFAALSWQLLKLYNAVTFSRAGAPRNITQIYRYFLGVFVCLQLAMFFLTAASSLWIDQVLHGFIAKLSYHTPVELAAYIFTIVMLLPWISSGWLSIRREKRLPLIPFYIIAAIFVGGWSFIFYSMVYRFLWSDWPFFACMTMFSFFLIISSVVLGGICQYHFGQGFAQYLFTEHSLKSMDFEPDFFYHEDQKGWSKEDEENAHRISLPVLPSDRSASEFSS